MIRSQKGLNTTKSPSTVREYPKRPGSEVGYYLGQGEPSRASAAGWLALAFGAGATLLVGVVLLPLSHEVMRVVTNDPEARGADGDGDTLENTIHIA